MAQFILYSTPQGELYVNRVPAKGDKIVGNVPASPLAVTFSPSSVTLITTGKLGDLVTAIAVQMSDNSTFAGTLALAGTANAGNRVAISKGAVVLARNLVASDVGSYTVTVGATANGASVTYSFLLKITLPQGGPLATPILVDTGNVLLSGGTTPILS